jgi:hypothetical protein
LGVRLRHWISVACIVWASSAWASAADDFEKARIAYVKKDYVEADARFKAMLDPKTGTLKNNPDIAQQAQFCWGAVKLAQNERDAALAIWEKLIRDSEGQFKPDELNYSKQVLQEFTTERENLNAAILQAQRQHAADIEAQRKREAEERARLEARVKELERLTAVETVEVKGSRLVAMLPFGIGQFQNGKNTLGWFFLLTESAAILTTVGLFAPYRYNIDQYNAVLTDPSPWSPFYRQRLANQYALVAQDLRTADLITLGVLGALMVGGIIEAQIDFRASYEYKRPRKKTSDAQNTIWPSFAPTNGGVQFGVLGRF